MVRDELAETKRQLADIIENRAGTILGGARYTYDLCYDHPNPEKARRVAVSILDCSPRRRGYVTWPVFEAEGSIREVIRKLRK